MENILKQNNWSQKEYRKTLKGSSFYFLNNYNQSDKKYGRGKGDLTVEDVMQMRLKGCAHCEETDWRNIGLNRKDNSLPHTKANCEPCCKKCNDKLHTKELEKTLDQIDIKTSEVIKTWKSASDASRNGYTQSHITECCRGEKTQYRGFLWKYHSTQEGLTSPS